jgi:hypothetical protein
MICSVRCSLQKCAELSLIVRIMTRKLRTFHLLYISWKIIFSIGSQNSSTSPMSIFPPRFPPSYKLEIICGQTDIQIQRDKILPSLYAFTSCNFAKGHIPKCIQKFPDRFDKEINKNNNKHSLRRNTKGCGGKTH